MRHENNIKFVPRNKKLPSAKNILGAFCYVQFSIVLLAAQVNRNSNRFQRPLVIKFPCVLLTIATHETKDTSETLGLMARQWVFLFLSLFFCLFFSFECYKVRQEIGEFNTKITIVDQHCFCMVKNSLSYTRLFVTR